MLNIVIVVSIYSNDLPESDCLAVLESAERSISMNRRAQLITQSKQRLNTDEGIDLVIKAVLRLVWFRTLICIQHPVGDETTIIKCCRLKWKVLTEVNTTVGLQRIASNQTIESKLLAIIASHGRTERGREKRGGRGAEIV